MWERAVGAGSDLGSSPVASPDLCAAACLPVPPLAAQHPVRPPGCSRSAAIFGRDTGDVVSLKATSLQVLCCAPRLEPLQVVQLRSSDAAGARPSETPSRLAVFTPKVAAFLGRRKLPGILLDHRMSGKKGWNGKGSSKAGGER